MLNLLVHLFRKPNLSVLPYEIHVSPQSPIKWYQQVNLINGGKIEGSKEERSTQKPFWLKESLSDQPCSVPEKSKTSEAEITAQCKGNGMLIPEEGLCVTQPVSQIQGCKGAKQHLLSHLHVSLSFWCPAFFSSRNSAHFSAQLASDIVMQSYQNRTFRLHLFTRARRRPQKE